MSRDLSDLRETYQHAGLRRADLADDLAAHGMPLGSPFSCATTCWAPSATATARASRWETT